MDRFVEWLENAEAGDVIMYLQADTAQRHIKARDFFYKASEEGKVFLYQKRVRFGVFNYYAKRISPDVGETLRPKGWTYE